MITDKFGIQMFSLRNSFEANAQKIANLANEYGLYERANGKNIEYLSKYHPEIMSKLKYAH